jgi:hypothetical protein
METGILGECPKSHWWRNLNGAEAALITGEIFPSEFAFWKGMLRGMNVLKFAWILPMVVLLGLASATAIRGSDLAEEYNQVKKIALKDPKVRAAFQRANDELDRRILEIDPSLKPFVEEQRGLKKKAAQSKKFTVKTTHVVAKGETLTSIAKRYHLSVDTLVRANHISKQTPLQLGQRLLIPSKR